MTSRLERTRRRQLSDQLLPLRETLPTAPRRGWLRAIREAYGMDLETFGKILGITRQGASKLETAEPKGAITVRRLREAADALDCDLVIVLVPRAPLEANLQRRALELARREAQSVGHTMALEDQALDEATLSQTIRDIAEEIIEENDPRMWHR